MLHSVLKKGRAVALVAATLIAAGQVAHADDVQLPRTMVWTSYDQGSAGFVEASAIADALDRQFGTTIRITPAGTAVGRLLPMQTGRATFGFAGNEMHFAAEAMFEFAARDWGPQDLRVVLGRPAQVGLVVGGDTDIMTPADLRGHRVGYVQASPSTDLNTNTVLAFADLTPADVEVVMYPGYGAMLQAFISGEIDAAPAIPTSAALREAEGGRGVRWLDMPASDEAGWGRIRAFASLFSPSQARTGVSISDEDPADLLGYRYPQLGVYANVSDDEVYNMIRALNESYDLYKDATPSIRHWAIAEAGSTPAAAPFHPGAVRYLREIGQWTDADQAWNDARIARIEAVRAAWDAAQAEATAAGVSDDDWPAFWDAYRAEHL